MTASAAAISSLDTGTAFTTAVVASIADMASSVARFIGMEMVERPLAAVRHGADVTMVRIVAVVDVAIKAVTAVKPWTGADEDSSNEPIRTVVAVGGATIGFIVEVPVRTHRRASNADGDLGRRA
jgi:hypothetical protein